MTSVARLRRIAGRLPGERYTVDRPVDARGQYQLDLVGDFPFAVKRLVYSADDPPPPLTWHTYLELFIPLSRACRLKVGATMLQLSAGDVLVMDHLKLHAVVDFPASAAEAIVIRFLPELVRGFATAAADHLLLLPFYRQTAQPYVMRATEAPVSPVHVALGHVIESIASAGANPYWQTGARAYFLETLHHLAQHFGATARPGMLAAVQHAPTHRLRHVLQHIENNYSSRVSLPSAAAIAGLSKPQFNTVFKRATGMTLIDYVTQLRLSHAVRLLRETDCSIADIALEVGFSDQSYFDRRFRQRFGRTPKEYRDG